MRIPEVLRLLVREQLAPGVKNNRVACARSVGTRIYSGR